MVHMMPESTYDALVEEVERIINSSYPTQLKHLRDLLCTTCTDGDISQWIISKPCELDRLVRCVLDGLPHWPYVLDIVTRLSHDRTIRDAFLTHEPTLLHAIIVQAVQSHNTSSRYSTAAVTMLSHPLAKDIALPVEVQTLFIHLWDRATQQPSVNNIRPIYRMLRGTSTLLLGLLSNSVLLKLEDHIFDILRNLKGDDQSLSLFCLAIMQTLASSKRELSIYYPVSSYDTQELLASTQQTNSTAWKPDTVQQFFTATKAQRTMQLIALRVMWACNASTGDSIDEKTEALSLANEIVTAVPVPEREVWRKANVLLLKKFEEKVFSPFLDSDIRFQALGFLVRLTEGSTIPGAVTDCLRKIILNVDKMVEALQDHNSEALEWLMRCGVFDENTTTAFVQNIVDFAASATPEQGLQYYYTLATVLHALRRAMFEQDVIGDGIMLALDVLSCGSKMNLLAQLVKASPGDLNAHSGICAQALCNARNGLIHELCSVFLRAALSSHQRYSISQDTVALTLDLYASTARNDEACSHTRRTLPASPLPVVFVESESTPDTIVMDWRQALKAEINKRADAEHKRLAAIFVASCKELESRCENVEQPLLDASDQKQQLQRKCDELQDIIADLESDKIDRRLQFDALEAERDQALQVVQNIRAEQDKSDAFCRDLEQRLVETAREAQEEVRQVHQSMEAAQLEHSTILAKQEETIETLQAEVAKLDQTKSELALSREEAERLQLADRQHHANIESLTKEKAVLLWTNETLTADLAKLNVELANEREIHQSNIQRIESEANQKLATVDEQRKQQLAELTNTHHEVLQGLKRKLADIETESDEARACHLRQLEQRDSDSQEKQRKIDRLTRKCEHKDKQIAEASAMRSNLMAAMGLGGGQPFAALPHRPPRSSTAQISDEHEETQNDPSPPTPCSGEDESNQQPAAGQSFTSTVSSNESRSGPTPKRPRSKRSSRNTPPTQPHVRMSTTSRASRSAAKRQPLMDTSSNSPKKPQGANQKILSNEKGVGLDDTTFEGSQLFAGTPIQNMLN